MAIQQTKKQSDLEKRLQLLRKQVYGNEFRIQNSEFRVKEQKTTNASDISYLHQDLLKIFTFSSVAIGAQLVLFFLLKNHILKIYFF